MQFLCVLCALAIFIMTSIPSRESGTASRALLTGLRNDFSRQGAKDAKKKPCSVCLNPKDRTSYAVPLRPLRLGDIYYDFDSVARIRYGITRIVNGLEE